MSNSTRRTFMMTVVAGTSILATSRTMAQAKVDPKDPKAVALSYVEDTKKIDTAKFPKFVAGSKCSNCAVYGGKPTDAVGACPLFAGQNVVASGWCSAYIVKKAA